MQDPCLFLTTTWPRRQVPRPSLPCLRRGSSLTARHQRLAFISLGVLEKNSAWGRSKSSGAAGWALRRRLPLRVENATFSCVSCPHVCHSGRSERGDSAGHVRALRAAAVSERRQRDYAGIGTSGFVSLHKDRKAHLNTSQRASWQQCSRLQARSSNPDQSSTSPSPCHPSPCHNSQLPPARAADQTCLTLLDQPTSPVRRSRTGDG